MTHWAAIRRYAADLFDSQAAYSLADALAEGRTAEEYAGDLFDLATADPPELAEALGFAPDADDLAYLRAQFRRLAEAEARAEEGDEE